MALRRIQNEDVKQASDVTSISSLINDNKIYVAGFSKTLAQAITDGDISGGGSGASLQWVEDTGAALAAVDFNNQVFQYEAGITQQVYALVRVPTSYVAGHQIFLKSSFYSVAVAGNALMRTQTTLIIPGTDLISSTTNQRTSTNSAVALSGATASIPQSVSFDLSSATGQINGVAIAAGHLIKIRLYRDTDTSTSDLNVPVYGSEVTFS